MGVYVSEITMPKGEGSKLVLQIFPNGEVYDGHGIRLGIANWAKAVPVPTHGDLIDMNAKIDVYDRYDDDIIRPTTVRGLINEYISGGYPRTIIRAEEGET